MAEQNNQKKNGGQQDANQLVQVRYDKLQMERTHLKSQNMT